MNKIKQCMIALIRTCRLLSGEKAGDDLDIQVYSVASRAQPLSSSDVGLDIPVLSDDKVWKMERLDCWNTSMARCSTRLVQLPALQCRVNFWKQITETWKPNQNLHQCQRLPTSAPSVVQCSSPATFANLCPLCRAMQQFLGRLCENVRWAHQCYVSIAN